MDFGHPQAEVPPAAGVWLSTVPEGTLVKYKFTRGDWTTVEVDGACAPTDNRVLVASWGTNGTMPVSQLLDAYSKDASRSANMKYLVEMYGASFVADAATHLLGAPAAGGPLVE